MSLEWLFLQNSTVICATLFLCLMAGAIGLPMPEDIPLIFGGVLINQSHTPWYIIFITCYFGILIGDLIIFMFGRKLGHSAVKRGWFSSTARGAMFEKTKRALEKRSFITIFTARHLFYLRTVTFLACGVVHMSVKQFLIADSVAALASASLMLSLGYLFSDNYSDIMRYMRTSKDIFLYVLVVALIGLLVFLRRKHRQQRSNLS